jgi:hypothetical protein
MPSRVIQLRTRFAMRLWVTGQHLEQHRNLGGIILPVRVERHHDVAAGRGEAGRQGGTLSRAGREPQDPEPPIPAGEPPQLCT